MAVPYYANASLPDTNSRQAAMTMRPSSTSLLCIDSEDRYANYSASRSAVTSPYNFSISKPESIMNGFLTRVGVTEVSFPWMVPNVNNKTNKITVTVTIGAAPAAIIPITLLNGFYTPAALATAIEAEIAAAPSAAGLGLTLQYGGTSLNAPYFQYAVGTGNTIAFSPLPNNTPAYPFGPQSKQLFDMLGFSLRNTVLAIDGEGDYTLCQAIRYVDICSSQLTYNQALKDTMSQTVVRDTLARLYLNSAPGITSTVSPGSASFCPPGCAPTVLYRDINHPKQIQWLPNQPIPGYISFQVYDDTGDLLDLSIGLTGSYGPASEGFDWSMTLQITEC